MTSCTKRTAKASNPNYDCRLIQCTHVSCDSCCSAPKTDFGAQYVINIRLIALFALNLFISHNSVTQ